MVRLPVSVNTFLLYGHTILNISYAAHCVKVALYADRVPFHTFFEEQSARILFVTFFYSTELVFNMD